MVFQVVSKNSFIVFLDRFELEGSVWKWPGRRSPWGFWEVVALEQHSFVIRPYMQGCGDIDSPFDLEVGVDSI